MDKAGITIYSFLTVLLAGALFFRFNADGIYAGLGNYYYKHNDINKAQAFFEKSFVLGNTNPAQREIYVKSMINSPLTVESQKKLVEIAEGEIQDSAAYKAKFFLYDLMREIHKKYPYNYIKQAPLNRRVVRWNKFPITYGFKNTQNVPEDYVKEIENAITEWEKASMLNILFSLEDYDKADIKIEFAENKVENPEYGKKYVVAYTTPSVNSDVLKEMNIKFYLRDPEGNYYSKNQIYNTALHEIFHAMGFMGHSYDKDNIMYLSKDNNTLINDTRDELTQGDKETLILLYKIEPDITNDRKLKGEYIPYLVLGDETEVNYSKAKEAKNYIRQAPELPSGYIDLAESYVAQKKYPEAVKCLEKALYLADSNDIKYIIYYNLAVSYYYINHFAMAEEYLADARKINDTEELHALHAQILFANKDVEGAIKQFTYLVSHYPDNINYAVELANIYISRHQYLKARSVLKNFLKKKPEMKNNEIILRYKFLFL